MTEALQEACFTFSGRFSTVFFFLAAGGDEGISLSGLTGAVNLRHRAEGQIPDTEPEGGGLSLTNTRSVTGKAPCSCCGS